MPAATVQKLTVFVAWPSDVERERNAVFKVVAEINATIGARFGVTVEARDWKSVVGPGAGRPQDVINKAVGTYDIFVGILWKRLGTPSGRAASGFVEEVSFALKAWRNRKKGGVSVLVYVREDSPRTLDAIDTRQLDAVRAYKATLFKRRTLLARAYKGASAFEALIRQHLTNEVLARIDHVPRAAPSPSPPARKPTGRKPAPRKPSPPRPLTDEDRAVFAYEGFTGVRQWFEKAAARHNRAGPPARIIIHREGEDAFTAEATGYGTRHSSARIRLKQPQWGAGWSLSYAPGFFLDEVSMTVVEVAGALWFESGVGETVFSSPMSKFSRHRVQKPAEVAAFFWERFTKDLPRR